MDVELIKERVKDILNADIHNRASIADLRRDVFLNSSKTEEKETQITLKQNKINELGSELDYFRNQLSIKDQSQSNQEHLFKNEKDVLLKTISEKEGEISNLILEAEKLNFSLLELNNKKSELSKLSIENSHYSEKIRELISHIETSNGTIEQNKREIATYKTKAEWAEKFKKELDEAKKSENDEINLLKKEIETLKENSEKKITGLKNDTELAINNHLNTILILKEEIVEMENSSATIISNLKQELENKVNNPEIQNDLASKLVLLDSKNCILEAINLELQDLNSKLQNENCDFQSNQSSAYTGAMEMIDALQTELNIEKQKNTELNKDIETINTLNLELSEQHSQFKITSDNAIENLNIDIEKISENLSLLKNSPFITDGLNNTSLIEEISTLKLQITTLNNQTEILTLENKTFNDTLLLKDEKLKESIELYSELEKAVKNNSEKTEIVPTPENALFDEQIKDLEIINLQLVTENAELKTKLEPNSSGLAENSEEYHKLAADNKSLNSLTVMLKKRILEVEIINKELKGKVESGAVSSPEDISLLQSNYELKLVDVQNIVNELNIEKIKLEDTVVDLKRELFKAEEKLENTTFEENDASTSTAIVTELQLKINALTEENSKITHQKQEMEIELPNLLAKIAELSSITYPEKNTEEGLEKNKISPNLATLLAETVNNKKTAKLKINELVREIDKCIAMLNAQS